MVRRLGEGRRWYPFGCLGLRLHIDNRRDVKLAHHRLIVLHYKLLRAFDAEIAELVRAALQLSDATCLSDAQLLGLQLKLVNVSLEVRAVRDEFKRERMHEARQVSRDSVLRDSDGILELFQPMLAARKATHVSNIETVLFVDELLEDFRVLQIAHVSILHGQCALSCVSDLLVEVGRLFEDTFDIVSHCFGWAMHRILAVIIQRRNVTKWEHVILFPLL